MQLLLLLLLCVCGCWGLDKPEHRRQPDEYTDYLEYDDLLPLDGTLFVDNQELPQREALEQRKDAPFIIPPSQDSSRPSNPARDPDPLYSRPFRNQKRKTQDEPPKIQHSKPEPSNVNLEEPVDLAEYDYEYEDYPYEDKPQSNDKYETYLPRAPIQERPGYQIPQQSPQVYKQPVQRIPERNDYRTQQENTLYKERRPQTEEELLKELEEEENKPDRLTLLLRETKFHCQQKGNGYYADDGLGCEVFHYCQDGVRSSWICPENQIFHQVHLICMPHSPENSVCQSSSNFYFVNDYLYQPITDDVHGGTVGYGDRYYPPGYQPGTGLNLEDAEIPEKGQIYKDERPYRLPINRQQNSPPRPGNDFYQSKPKPQEYIPRPPPRIKAPVFQPEQPYGSAANPQQTYVPANDQNVYYSPEDVVIPHSQRRSYQPPEDMKTQQFEDFVDLEELLKQREQQES